MGILIRMAALVPLLLASPLPAQNVMRWRPFVQEASARFAMPVDWIERVIGAESAGRTMAEGRPIRSKAGAMGLMQLMPGTWAEMRERYGLGHNPDDPRDNIIAGTAYLRLMYERFGYPGLFGAYNAGPARYADYLATARPLPAETTAYIANLSGTSRSIAMEPSGPVRETLFALRKEARLPEDAAASSHQAGALFALRSEAP